VDATISLSKKVFNEKEEEKKQYKIASPAHKALGSRPPTAPHKHRIRRRKKLKERKSSVFVCFLLPFWLLFICTFLLLLAQIIIA
jgi:hypothetical protein